MDMHRRAFLFSTAGLTIAPSLGLSPQTSGSGGSDALFDAWKQSFIDKAAGAGWPRTRLTEIFAHVEPDPDVIKRDRTQPELVKPVGDYIKGVLSQAQVSQGRDRYETSSWLPGIQERYSVPGEILVGIWGIESSYGRFQGDRDIIRSLATLAAEGRRRDWAEGQLFACLKIMFSGLASRPQLKGSWAGAMGQTQFTPEDYLAWGVDGNGDGRRDIWNTPADALASSANFLAHKAAWRPHESWTREVVLPHGFDYSLAEGNREPVDFWESRGAQPADEQPWRKADRDEAAQLILPAGWEGPAFLAFPNHFAIRAYNNSVRYALAVGLLADRIANRPGVLTPWPEEQPISLADRIAAQEALARLGFDPGPPDGALGLRTRQAAQQWQKAQGLPADGYLTLRQIQRLKAQTGVVAVPPPPPVSPGSA
jgi:lytic murein transglycosylase